MTTAEASCLLPLLSAGFLLHRFISAQLVAREIPSSSQMPLARLKSSFGSISLANVKALIHNIVPLARPCSFADTFPLASRPPSSNLLPLAREVSCSMHFRSPDH
jgi:hypothetical protein